MDKETVAHEQTWLILLHQNNIGHRRLDISSRESDYHDLIEKIPSQRVLTPTFLHQEEISTKTHVTPYLLIETPVNLLIVNGTMFDIKPNQTFHHNINATPQQISLN